MMARKKDAGKALRQEAERIAREQAVPSEEALVARSPEAVQLLVHELRVHQIELEMQNEELRRAQIGLDASRARYFDLYDLAPVGYCTVSEEGLILEANLTAATLFGVARTAVVKRPLTRFILKADQDIYFLCRNRLLQTKEPQSCELRMVKPDGTTFWASLAASVGQDVEGALVHRVMLSDISERKLLDQALRETNVKLERARSVADKASLAKSEFLSSMSHELRSPLNAILGFAQLMEMDSNQTAATRKEGVGQILRAGWYLLELINDVLDLATVESGKVTLSLEPTSVAEVLSDCRAMIEPQILKSGIQVQFPVLEAPWMVSADRTRLKQVLVNLISNAIKYNRPGGSVTVTLGGGTPGRLRISVQDTGAGLSTEKVAQLFQSFNRLGREGGPEDGTGIGLMVSKRLVELMGGEIGARSAVGEGSVFWFELNLAGAAQPDPGAGARLAAKPGVAPQVAALRTVLYVEDHLPNMQLVEKLIARRSDLRLLSAPDAPRGIALSREQQPSVILMDINLPGLNGLQALKLLQEDPVTAKIPVLALSANAMPEDVEKGREAGFLRYLTKPIKIDEFMQALDLALELAEASQAAAVQTP